MASKPKVVEGVGKVKFRVIAFELEGTHATLQDTIRGFTAALNRPNQTVSPRALRSSGSTEIESAPAQEDEAAEEGADEFSEAVEVVDSPGSRKQSPPRAKPRVPTYEILQDLVFDDVTPTLKEFAAAKSPPSDLAKYLVIAFWFKHFRRAPDLKPDHFYTAYRLLGWKVPRILLLQFGNFGQTEIIDLAAARRLAIQQSIRLGKYGRPIGQGHLKNLEHFVSHINGFSKRPAPFIIEVFAWYLHEVKAEARISTSQIAACFDAAHVARPSNIAASLSQLCGKTPPRMLRDADGYRLSGAARLELAKIAPIRASAVRTTELLNGLLARVSNPIQKTFLSEALVCYRHGAFRAAVVMVWNLAFSAVIDRILSGHLTEFNSQIGTHGFKRAIATRADFEELKEGQIITLARNAHVLSKETVKTLEEKLGKRNTSAHPSAVVVSAATAEEVIFDLVENVVLKVGL